MIPEKTDDNISLTTVQKVIDYIEENIEDDLTPSDIATYFYSSVSAISLLFRAVCGMTIMEYVRNRRLSLAGEELVTSNIRIIDLAYKYGYETPEAFTKAFTRLHGFPPSFVRRGFTITKIFKPIHISVNIEGGCDTVKVTKDNSHEQDSKALFCYDNVIKNKGEILMESKEFKIDTNVMKYRKEWDVICSLVKDLEQSNIKFKIDGKTMIFAHGLEFVLDKICLTFKWGDEEAVKDFFGHNEEAKHAKEGFKYFDVMYEDMKLRCMFYGECPDADTDEFLYKNTDLVWIDSHAVRVQSLEFYYENAEKNTEYYSMVKEWFKR